MPESGQDDGPLGPPVSADAYDLPSSVGPPTERTRDAALADLYRTEYRNLVRLAGLLGGAQDRAEEIVQDAFVKLDESWDRVATPSDRPAYLRSIVLNLARSGLRHTKVIERHLPLPSPDAAAAEHHAVIAEDQREVVAAIQALPDRQKQCMVLRFYEELTEVEIADALGISQGSVKTHLHRAMQTLGKRLGDLA